MNADAVTPDRAAPVLTAGRIALLSVGFVVPLAVLNRALRWVDNHVVDIDRPPYWPIGVFEPRWPDATGLLVAAGCLVFFVFAERILRRRGYPLPLVTICGLLLILGTNLIHGVREGCETPIAGGEPAIQYYHDALRIDSAANFLAHYTDIQPSLLDHARTHPPGAVLSFYLWHRLIAGVEASGSLVTEPVHIALMIALISTVASACFFHGLLCRHMADRAVAGWTTFALLLLPAVQIYYCASLDALIAAAMLGVMYFLSGVCSASGGANGASRGSTSPCARILSRSPPVIPFVALVACLFATSFLTFAACFLPPVMAAYEYASRRGIHRTVAAVIGCAGLYALAYGLTGFNYAESFRIASALENPQGFRLFADPVSYVFTRIECVLEILVFLGPFAAWVILVVNRQSAGFLSHRLLAGATPAGAPLATLGFPLLAANRAALLTLLVMFVAGVFHTAETARACLFVYPLLILLIARWCQAIGGDPHSRRSNGSAALSNPDHLAAWAMQLNRDPPRLLALLFVQSLLMQLFGAYFW